MERLHDHLNAFELKGLKRFLRQANGPQGRKIVLDGQELLNFCSNNYLGLADDPRLIEAAICCMGEEGFGSGASRLVCGNLSAHTRLEESVARLKGAESALLFSSGYMANVGIISSVCDKKDLILSDRFNHASIVDGILLSGARFKRYPHRDMSALKRLLQEASGFNKCIIITDSVFSMEGDVAPLDEIVALAQKYDCMVMIDEAHAFGVLGNTGQGAAEHFDVQDQIDIQMGTFSKAAGSFGAYCCGSKELTSFLINKARSFIYTTALPPAVAAASQAAVEIIANDSSLRNKLWENTLYVRDQLKHAGFDLMDSTTPIIPIIVKDNDLAVNFAQQLKEEGIFISAIRPPTVPVNTARLRLTIMATHTMSDLDQLLNALIKVGKKLCLI